MKKQIVIAALLLHAAIVAAGQDYEPSPQEKMVQEVEMLGDAVAKLRKLKVSGYIQAQYQYGQADADGSNFKLSNRAITLSNKNAENDGDGFGRIGVRRGRIKFAYESGIVSGVFQPDFTEKGLAFKDVYLAIKDPWVGTNAVKLGIFDRPFGHEIAYSSSQRESPERARIVQALFPDERDVGGMLTLQAAKTSAWNVLKLDAGLFAGNGIRNEIDSRLDFIGRLSVQKSFGSMVQVGGGVSAYIGGVLQNDSSVYRMEGKAWQVDKRDENIGRFARRHYYGVDAQAALLTAAGETQVRAEYIVGQHPGNSAGAYDFKPAAPYTGAVYMRRIAGAYVMVAQDLWRLPLTLVVKYDFYDPNTDIAGDEVQSVGDIERSNLGVGLLWKINAALRLTCYFDFVGNERSIACKGYEHGRKDNVLTLRMQYKF